MAKFRWLKFQALLVAAVFALLIAGCSIIPRPTESFRLGQADAIGGCAGFFSSLDNHTSRAEALDPGAFRVEGYPYLRVNRFLASFRGEVGEDDAFNAWMNRMQALDQEARKAEIANLPRAEDGSSISWGDQAGVNARVASCGNLLKAEDFQSRHQQAAMREKATVPDEYLSLWRVLGLYPLTSFFVSRGVSNWHAEAYRTFSVEPPVGWRSTLYVHERSSELVDVRQIVKMVKQDALGIPDCSPSAREALFRAFAPIWEVQTEGESITPRAFPSA